MARKGILKKKDITVAPVNSYKKCQEKEKGRGSRGNGDGEKEKEKKRARGGEEKTSFLI